VGGSSFNIHSLKLRRAEGNDPMVAQVLEILSNANRSLGLNEEGMEQAKEALEIYERLNSISGQARSLSCLAWLLETDGQLDAAEEAASRAIDLLPNEGEEYLAAECHRLLSDTYHSKGEMEEVINHLETALGITSSFNWHCEISWIHCSLAELFFDENRFDDAHTHAERAKGHAINDAYILGRVMDLQANFWYKECRFEEAKSEALRAASACEKVGATNDVEECRKILRKIEEQIKKTVISGE